VDSASDGGARSDTDLLEYVCNENESRRQALSGPSDEQKRVELSAEALSKYAGRYVVDGPAPGIPFKALELRLVDGELLMDIDGRGSLPLSFLSTTRFSVRLFELEFRPNERGEMEAEIPQAGVRLVRK
jgi:hypothetical protein